MTDYTKLVEQLYASARGPSMFWEAAAAIEALQGENERLKDINRDALSNLNELCDSKNAEIAGLQAKLDELQRQEPLTDKQISDGAKQGYDPEDTPEIWSFQMGARFAETHHGITKGTP